MNYLMVLLILISGGSVSASAREEARMKFNEQSWQKEWDFNARTLDLSDGYPSKIGFIIQPRIERLEIFGEVGKFPSARGGFVGFAQLTTEIGLPNGVKSIVLRAHTKTPHTVVKFILKSSNQKHGSYQANIVLGLEPEEITFSATDFVHVVRGQANPDANLIDFGHITHLGFLVTRSSQAQADDEVVFDFSVNSIKFTTQP